jgi:hypothetical protein
MLKLSNVVKTQLAGFSVEQYLQLPNGILSLYWELTSDEVLNSYGYLNVVFENTKGKLFVIPETDMGPYNLTDKSPITGIWMKNDTEVVFYHWGGYESIFDAYSLEFKSQKFSK